MHVTSQDCIGSGISLNGKELDSTWTGSLSSGSGSISSLSNDVDATQLSANWQSLCISTPSNSLHTHVAQILTVRVDDIGGTYIGDDVGFTVLFTQVGKPEILRLSTHPLNISINSVDLDTWRDPVESDRLENQPDADLPGNSPSEEEVDLHWVGLKTQARGLRRPEISAGEDSNSALTSNKPISGDLVNRAAIPDLGFTSQHEVKLFFRDCAIIFLIVAIGVLVFKVFGNTTQCRRRRADLAARREERRKRRAYRSAARRLRWRQWWEGRSHHGSPSSNTPSNYRLEEIGNVERAQQPPAAESNGPPEQGAVQAEIPEILGLRRVLEFVGELVRNGDSDAERSLDSQRYSLPTTRNPTAHPPPSSTAGLTTVYSSRASSLMSLDTTSSLTLDTLETGDTQPPPYHG